MTVMGTIPGRVLAVCTRPTPLMIREKRFEPFQQWMGMLQANVGILHAGIHVALEGGAEHFRETEVLTPFAPLIVETCFVCGDNAPASLDIAG